MDLELLVCTTPLILFGSFLISCAFYNPTGNKIVNHVCVLLCILTIVSFPTCCVIDVTHKYEPDVRYEN